MAETIKSDDYERGLQEAWHETQEILAADPSRSAADPTLPVFQFAARESLDEERARFDAGDKVALLGAIRICANHDLVMPEWVSRGFIRSYDKVVRCSTASWDDAFGLPFPKGAHLSAIRTQRLYPLLVRLEITRAHDGGRGRAIDESLSEDVGRPLGLGKTLVSEYYYGKRRVPQKSRKSRK